MVLLLAAFYTACGAWLLGGGDRATVVSPDGAYRLEFHAPSRLWLLVHGEMRAPGRVQLHQDVPPHRKVAESAVVDLHQNHGITWEVGTRGRVAVGRDVSFAGVPRLDPAGSRVSQGDAGFALPRTSLAPLDWVWRASRRGFPLAVLAGACFLVLDLFLVGYTLATGRARERAGAAVQHSAWVFGGAAWVGAALVLLGWRMWKPFVVGVLLLGVGVIPAAFFVMLPFIDRTMMWIIAALAAAAAAWYVGRRLRRGAAALNAPPPTTS